jgi:hypothetical protein
MTEFEAGVRELVARLRDFERRMKKTEDDAGALEQMVKLITPGLGFDAPGPNTTVQGTVKRCSSASSNPNVSSGATVSVVRVSDGAVLGTATADASGIYSVPCTVSGGTPVNITATDTGPDAIRYAATTISASINTGTNGPLNIALVAASGYGCFRCPDGVTFRALKATLNVSDSVYGSFTITYATTGTIRWTTTRNINFAGNGACAAVNGVDMIYNLTADTVFPALGVSFRCNGSCPTATGVLCGATTSSNTTSCTTLSYHATGNIYPAGGATVVITEPP